MPRFVILWHELPADSDRASHFDLMLDWGSGLRTWEMPDWPMPGRVLRLRSLADHRREYLDYEGPVSRNRGSVSRRDTGSYELLSPDADRLEIEFRGEHLRGSAVLERADDDDHWRLILAPAAPTGV